jgi:hypothetical protein
MITAVIGDTQPKSFFAVTLYVPGATLSKIPVVFVYVEISILYVSPVPFGELMVMVPVLTAQVGLMTVTFGAAGLAGTAIMVTETGVEKQPCAFFDVTV